MPDDTAYLSLAELSPERREYLRGAALRYAAGILTSFNESTDFENEVEAGIIEDGERDALGDALGIVIADLDAEAASLAERCEHGYFRSGAGACPKCGGGVDLNHA